MSEGNRTYHLHDDTVARLLWAVTLLRGHEQRKPSVEAVTDDQMDDIEAAAGTLRAQHPDIEEV